MTFYAPCSVLQKFQDCLAWCGWEINFAHDTIQLMKTKLVKLEDLITTPLDKRKVLRKTLEQCIGLLIWATSIALHLRPWMAPLYADLHSPPGSMHSASCRHARSGRRC